MAVRIGAALASRSERFCRQWPFPSLAGNPAASPALSEATLRIMHTICETLGWELGVMWIEDPDAKELLCLNVWQAPGDSIAGMPDPQGEMSHFDSDWLNLNNPSSGGRYWPHIPTWLGCCSPTARPAR